MKRTTLLCALSFALAVTCGFSAGQAKHRESKPVQTHAVHVDAGERAFQENCSRCHAAPESLSPRISGTVVRHMRVRANLSANDERLILEYLNP
jgi:cytochrome c5